MSHEKNEDFEMEVEEDKPNNDQESRQERKWDDEEDSLVKCIMKIMTH